MKYGKRLKWLAFCCKCKKEAPVKGGVFPDAKGKSYSSMVGGVQRRFICLECNHINRPSV